MGGGWGLAAADSRYVPAPVGAAGSDRIKAGSAVNVRVDTVRW